MTALGVSVSVYRDADAFAASTASLVGPQDADHTEPPAHYAERGWAWPPRMAPQSFISHGVFGPAEDARAYAFLAGTVWAADRRTVTQTGQDFSVARIDMTGFDADLCLAAADHPRTPEPGQVIAEYGVHGRILAMAALPPPIR